MRLQKYLAQSGVASRRAAEKLIAEGHVTVNGEKITQMGVQVEETDRVAVDGKVVHLEEEKHYLLYYKPIGEVTTVQDPEGRPTVLDKFRDYPVRLVPAGRLDFDSEGLLLLTNDGDVIQRVLHPSHEVEKSYLTKEVRRIADRMITLAIKECDNNVQTTKQTHNDKGQLMTLEVVNDAPSKLHARRLMMAYLYDLKEQKKADENKKDYKERTKDNKHPVVEKLFREIGPKYKARNAEKNCSGGYTRIYKLGPRRGEAAEMGILELV